MTRSKQIRLFLTYYLGITILLALTIFFNAFEKPNDGLNKAIQMIAGVSTDKLRTLPDGILFLLSVVVAIIPSIIFLRLHIKRAPTLTFATLCTLIFASLTALFFHHLLIPLLYLLIALGLGTAAAIILKMIYASNEQEFLRLAFSQFVSEDMLKQLLKDPNLLKLQGKEADITLLFMDIRGFTTFSENNAPTVVVKRLNELLDKVTEVILNHDGTIDKYIGDAVMAMWGAPGKDDLQATHAAQAALAIRKIIQNESEFRVGIGIHYGPAIVGNIGSSRRFDYTAIGDTVNTAARLESATKELQQTIILSEAVLHKLTAEKSQAKNIHDLGIVKLKGKNNGIHVYGVE